MQDPAETSLNNPTDWILLPPSGRFALFRAPASELPNWARLASGAEFMNANYGRAFPWGNLPNPSTGSSMWRKHRIGIGGLRHNKWFVTKDGRFGGAPNIPDEIPGCLRACIFLDGGLTYDSNLAENEGYAAVCETSAEEQLIYRRVQLYAAEHVMADGGLIIISRIGEDGIIRVGFVGRCQYCPNAEQLSFKQLCRELPDLNFKLWPEWERWSVSLPTNSLAERC